MPKYYFGGAVDNWICEGIPHLRHRASRDTSLRIPWTEAIHEKSTGRKKRDAKIYHHNVIKPTTNSYSERLINKPIKLNQPIVNYSEKHKNSNQLDPVRQCCHLMLIVNEHLPCPTANKIIQWPHAKLTQKQSFNSSRILAKPMCDIGNFCTNL